MRKLYKVSYLLLFSFLFVQCSKEFTLPQDLVVQDFIWKGLNAYYLHQNQIDDLSDRRFNNDQELNAYLRTFPDNNTLFSSLLINSDTKSTLLEDYTNLDIVTPRTAFTNGLEFGIIAAPNNTENVIGYVTHILPNSNAASKNIVRGEFFNAVDGVQLTQTNFESLLINGSNEFDLNMVNFDGFAISPSTKTVNLEKENYSYDAVFLERSFTVGANNIGYLMYNNSFSSNSIFSLNGSFLNFKNQNINQLILDLRYNISGTEFAKNIAKFSTLITGQFPEETFIKEEWNTKAQSWFLENQPDSLLTKFPAQFNNNTPFNSLNLKDIYIILNGDNFAGSSSIELLINSLKPYINVQVIGTNTIGNNTGAITLYNSEDYNFANRNTTHTVALQPKVLSFYNNNDQTYANGFTPNISICTNEDILNLGVLGERTEPILERVLDYLVTGNAGVNSICNPNNYQYIYNSLDAQRITDNGVFIKQNLPNTN